jgi:RimJ/RimL family protein N-acetyltransferase
MRLDDIRTERLVMRTWRADDRDPFAAMNADPEVMRYFPSVQDRASSDAFADRIERRFAEQGFGLWALELRETGEFIGFTGLNPMPDDVPGAGGMEAGWRSARHVWRRGYATEAAQEALRVGFAHVGLAEIWSLTAALNTPSVAVMRRLGMKEHATVEHPRIDVCHPIRPHVVYRLTRTEWSGGVADEPGH